MRERVRRGARVAAAAAMLGAGLRMASARGAEPDSPPPPGNAGGPGAVGEPSPEPAGPDGAALIGGRSSCPQPEAVWAELGTLVPRDHLTARLRAVAGPGAPVEIADLGVHYRVIAAGRVREYRDESRDCANRARIAALFVALAVDPGDVLTAEPAAAPTPSPPAMIAPPPIAAPPPRPMARLELGAVVDGGLGPGARVGQAGVALRAAFGRGRVALAAGIVGLAPVDTSVGGVGLHQWRVPADVGARVHFIVRGLEPYGELGLCVALLQERALDLAVAQTQTAFEIGARGAVGLRLGGGGRVVPFFALQADLVPSPPAIFALPRGVVGNTPVLWIGASAGASLGLF